MMHHNIGHSNVHVAILYTIAIIAIAPRMAYIQWLTYTMDIGYVTFWRDFMSYSTFGGYKISQS